MNSSASKLSPELAALAAEGARIDAETSPPPLPELDEQGAIIEPPPPADYQAEALTLVNMAADYLAAFYPSTAAVLDTDKRQKIAAASVPVMEKYGFTLGSFFGAWGAEINLAFVLSTVAAPVYVAIQKDRTEKPATPPAGTMQPVIDRTDPNSLHSKA